MHQWRAAEKSSIFQTSGWLSKPGRREQSDPSCRWLYTDDYFQLPKYSPYRGGSAIELKD
jgi:hypothetical protein